MIIRCSLSSTSHSSADGLSYLLAYFLFDEKIRQSAAQVVVPARLAETKTPSKHKMYSSCIFWFGGKEDGFRTNKPSSQELGDIG
jgi:hypothetical protein